MQESGLTEIMPFDIHSTYLGPVSYIFPSWVSSGLIVRSGYSLMTARWQVFFSFLNSLRAHQLTLASIYDDGGILSLLIWRQYSIYPFIISLITVVLCLINLQEGSKGQRAGPQLVLWLWKPGNWEVYTY